MTNAPAGWYPNQHGPGQRYWDGQQWTDQFAPATDPVASHGRLSDAPVMGDVQRDNEPNQLHAQGTIRTGSTVDGASPIAGVLTFLQRKWIRGLPVWVFVAGGLVVALILGIGTSVIGGTSPTDACNDKIRSHGQAGINKGSVSSKEGTTKGGDQATFVSGSFESSNGVSGRFECTVNDDGDVIYLNGDYIGPVITENGEVASGVDEDFDDLATDSFDDVAPPPDDSYADYDADAILEHLGTSVERCWSNLGMTYPASFDELEQCDYEWDGLISSRFEVECWNSTGSELDFVVSFPGYEGSYGTYSATGPIDGQDIQREVISADKAPTCPSR